MPLQAVAVVGTGLVGINAVRVVQTLFGVGRNACCAAATDVARVIVGTNGGRHFCVAYNGAAAMGTTGVARHPCAGVQFLAATTNIRFIKEAFEGPLGGAQVSTASGFAA